MRATPRRWVVMIAGMLAMLGPGALYSYSLFSQPLIASFGWSAVQTTWAFALANFFLGVGCVAGGFLQSRLGSRRVALIGTGLWGFGNILAGLLTGQYGSPGLYLSYGVIGGLGCGMVYITVLNAATNWFPERRGFGTGLAVMGFGLGSFVYSNVIKLLPQFHDVSAGASAYLLQKAQSGNATSMPPFDPNLTHTLLMTLQFSGMAFILFGVWGSLFVVSPPEDYVPDGYDEPIPLPDATPGEMLAAPQFYLLWVMLFLNVTAGAIVISNAIPIMQELTQQSAGTASGWYAGIALFNGLGRFFWGALSDRIGRRLSFALVLGIQVLVFFALDSLHDIVTVSIAFAVVLLCYGGGFGLMPAFNSDFFGNRHFAPNYGIHLTAWGCAGILGPWFGSTVKDLTGSFSAALQPVAVMLLVAILFPLISDKPRRIRQGTA